MKSHFAMMADYNAWANGRLYRMASRWVTVQQCVAKLRPGAVFPGSFSFGSFRNQGKA